MQVYELLSPIIVLATVHFMVNFNLCVGRNETLAGIVQVAVRLRSQGQILKNWEIKLLIDTLSGRRKK